MAPRPSFHLTIAAPTYPKQTHMAHRRSFGKGLLGICQEVKGRAADGEMQSTLDKVRAWKAWKCPAKNL